MDNISDHPAESSRKVQKSGNRTDVGRIRCASADPLQPRAPKEWKLVLCHVPGDTELMDILEFFRESTCAEIKGIMRDVKYGERLAIEVTFCDQSQMKKALERFNHEELKGHQVNLKTPKEALQEMADTEHYWNFLPPNLKDEVLSYLAFFHQGKMPAEVGRFWRESLNRTQRLLPRTQIENLKYGTAASPFYPSYDELGDIDHQITHLVLYSPPKLPDFERVHQCSLYSPVHMTLKQLTLFRADRHVLDVTSMNYGKPSHHFNMIYKYINTITILDSFLQLEILVVPNRRWLLAVLVPRWRLTIPDSTEQEVAKSTLFIREVVSVVESFDRWWPYPIKQLKWLQETFTKISDFQRQEITAYLTSTGRAVYGNCLKAAKLLPTSVTFEKHELNKMDCAFIGHYLTPTKGQSQSTKKEPGIKPPPCRWMNCAFMMSSKQSLQGRWNKKLEEVRQKGSSQ